MAYLTEFPITPKPIGSGHQYLLRNARAKARQLKYQAPYILMLTPAANRLKICSERRSAKNRTNSVLFILTLRTIIIISSVLR